MWLSVQLGVQKYNFFFRFIAARGDENPKSIIQEMGIYHAMLLQRAGILGLASVEASLSAV